MRLTSVNFWTRRFGSECSGKQPSDKSRSDAIRYCEGLGFVASHEGLKLHLRDLP